MANLVYPKFRTAVGKALVDLRTADVRIMLVLSTYTYAAAHEFLSDLGAVDNGRSVALTNKTWGTVAEATLDADDTTLAALAAAASKALVGFIHTGVDATARLVFYEDTPTLGLPFTPALLQNVPIAWAAGGILAL